MSNLDDLGHPNFVQTYQLSSVIQRPLTSIIIDDSINRIIALSDIHSDIHALIICLRDCARVIRKIDSIPINIDEIDRDTEDLLELNLNIHEDKYT